MGPRGKVMRSHRHGPEALRRCDVLRGHLFWVSEGKRNYREKKTITSGAHVSHRHVPVFIIATSALPWDSDKTLFPAWRPQITVKEARVR